MKKRNLKKMNKRADISITLLVLMAFALAVSTLFVFNTNTSQIIVKIEDAKYLDRVYMKEDKINFYLNEIMEKAAAGITDKSNAENAKKQLIENFKKEMEKYEKNGIFPIDAKKIKEQLAEKNIEINGDVISIQFSNIEIYDNLKNKISAGYSYDLKVEGKFGK